MKTCKRRLLSLFLAAALCAGLCVPAMAAGDESENAASVAAVAQLSTERLNVSEEAQTITLTVSQSAATEVCSAEYSITCTNAQGEAADFVVSEPTVAAGLEGGLQSWNPEALSFMYMSLSAVSTADIATHTITVPANTPAGRYTITVSGIEVGDYNGNLALSGATATATLTIADSDVTTMIGTGDLTDGAYTITGGGKYQLESGLSYAVINVNTTDAVTIIGGGVDWNDDITSEEFGTIYSAPNRQMLIDCSAAPGAALTLKDVYISNVDDGSAGHNLVNFSGTNNTLIFDGTVILDQDTTAKGYAGIHVGPDTELTIYGTTGSHAYLYKSEQAAGIGANNGEVCGNITFGKAGGANDFYFYMKGSKQGAVIGNGASCPGTPGDITFLSGIYNLVAVARGALIGGSAGTTSAAAGNVYVKGGLLNLNVDFSGAAIGGGGYNGGNDKGGGYLYVSGGSLRTYIDTNAVSSWANYGVTEAGVNDAAITATKVNAAGDPVYLLAVDTSGVPADTYTIEVDGIAYYSGSRYEYCYFYETKDRGEDGKLPTTPLGTPGNWVPMEDETNLYLYLTGKDHTISINGGEAFTVCWDADNSTFYLDESPDTPAIMYGDVNGDGKISLFDYMLIRQYINGTANLDADQLVAADVNGDGRINLLDYMLVRQYINGSLSAFPAETAT